MCNTSRHCQTVLAVFIVYIFKGHPYKCSQGPGREQPRSLSQGAATIGLQLGLALWECHLELPEKAGIPVLAAVCGQ